MPSGVPPQQGTVAFDDYSYHLRFDGVTGGMVGAAAAPGPGWSPEENLLGHRSGVCGSSPWMSAINPKPAPYQDSNSGGTVTYAAGPGNAVVDTAKAWVVNQWKGKTVFAVVAGGISKAVIDSNTATQLSFATGAAWSNGTPANGALYIICPDGVGPSQTRFRDNWWAALRQDGNSAQAGSGPSVEPNVQ